MGYWKPTLLGLQPAPSLSLFLVPPELGSNPSPLLPALWPWQVTQLPLSSVCHSFSGSHTGQFLPRKYRLFCGPEPVAGGATRKGAFSIPPSRSGHAHSIYCYSPEPWVLTPFLRGSVQHLIHGSCSKSVCRKERRRKKTNPCLTEMCDEVKQCVQVSCLSAWHVGDFIISSRRYSGLKCQSYLGNIAHARITNGYTFTYRIYSHIKG